MALARALATRPRLLLLDEPLAALDVGLRERILPYLLRVRDEWKTPVLYVTHNVGEALALAGQLLLLRDGRVEANGAPLDLLAAPGMVERRGARRREPVPGPGARRTIPRAASRASSCRRAQSIAVPLAAELRARQRRSPSP